MSVHPSSSPGGKPDLNKSGGKGNHLTTLKSLGLLHDLHDYIQTVENMASEQRRELERIREQKKELEKAVYRSEVRPEKGAFGEYFSNSELADLPPRLRAIVEDNRTLKDKVKKYKTRVQTWEHQAAQLQAQNLALVAQVEVLKQQLSACSRTPEEADREAGLRARLEERSTIVKTLEHSVGVMKAKVETDAKLAKAALSQAAKERDNIQRQLVQANKLVEERDRELRSVNIELRRALRKAVPTRGGVAGSLQTSPSEANLSASSESGLPSSAPPAGAAGGLEGAAEPHTPTRSAVTEVGSRSLASPPSTTTPPLPQPSETAPSSSEVSTHVMLVIVRDSSLSAGPSLVDLTVHGLVTDQATHWAQQPPDCGDDHQGLEDGGVDFEHGQQQAEASLAEYNLQRDGGAQDGLGDSMCELQSPLQQSHVDDAHAVNQEEAPSPDPDDAAAAEVADDGEGDTEPLASPSQRTSSEHSQGDGAHRGSDGAGLDSASVPYSRTAARAAKTAGTKPAAPPGTKPGGGRSSAALSAKKAASPVKPVGKKP